MGLLSGLIATNVISETSDTVFFFRSISTAVFFFLPMLVSFSAAKVFKVNEYIALAVASAMLSPALLQKAAALKEAGANPELNVFGVVPIELLGYGGAIVPAILAVWYYLRSHHSLIALYLALLNRYLHHCWRSLSLLLWYFLLLPLQVCG